MNGNTLSERDQLRSMAAEALLDTLAPAQLCNKLPTSAALACSGGRYHAVLRVGAHIYRGEGDCMENAIMAAVGGLQEEAGLTP